YEDDEDEQDDADDHARAKPTVRRTAGVHVDLAHVYLLSVTRLAHSQAACPTDRARSYARPTCVEVRCVTNGSLDSSARMDSARSQMRSPGSLPHPFYWH